MGRQGLCLGIIAAVAVAGGADTACRTCESGLCILNSAVPTASPTVPPTTAVRMVSPTALHAVSVPTASPPVLSERLELDSHHGRDNQPYIGAHTHLGPIGSATEDGRHIFRPFATSNPGIDPDLDPDLDHVRFDYRPGDDAVDDLVGSMNTTGLPREVTPALWASPAPRLRRIATLDHRNPQGCLHLRALFLHCPLPLPPPHHSYTLAWPGRSSRTTVLVPTLWHTSTPLAPVSVFIT